MWLYYRYPLSLQMVDELLAARGVIVSHETVRQWALKELCWNLGDAVIRRRSVLACW